MFLNLDQYLSRSIQFSIDSLNGVPINMKCWLQTAQLSGHNTGVTLLFSRSEWVLLSPPIERQES